MNAVLAQFNDPFGLSGLLRLCPRSYNVSSAAVQSLIVPQERAAIHGQRYNFGRGRRQCVGPRRHFSHSTACSKDVNKGSEPKPSSRAKRRLRQISAELPAWLKYDHHTSKLEARLLSRVPSSHYSSHVTQAGLSAIAKQVWLFATVTECWEMKCLITRASKRIRKK